MTTQATAIELGEMLISFCGKEWLTLHTEVTRDSQGFVDFQNSLATLHIKSPEYYKLFYVSGYHDLGFDAVDREGFFAEITLKDGADLYKAESLWVEGDWEVKRVALSLIDWCILLHFKNDADDSVMSQHFEAFSNNETIPLYRFAHCAFLFPGLNVCPKDVHTPPPTRSLKPSASKDGKVYLIGCEQTNCLKIGFTTNIEQRLKTLQQSNPHTLILLSTRNGTLDTERQLLNSFKHLKLRGEWFIWDESIIAAFKEVAAS